MEKQGSDVVDLHINMITVAPFREWSVVGQEKLRRETSYEATA